ncbi:DUF3783 domain-containing protein [Anaerosinus massiliensis]|uniref:DUF3783 domain-containing protein n=1 Tax=Massilibacillus massiliensis TaxID=1806837 RepID=UPI000DA63339|nr:DUF3783 domain-containing protein [Massilibacillus massiliensis]
MKKTKELVLLYHFTDQEKEAKIKSVLTQMKIGVKDISEEMIVQKVGYLVEAANFKETISAEIVESFDQEVMVMYGIHNKRMNEILAKFKDAQIEKIALKAMVTQYNIFWSFSRLCKTIQKDHLAYINKEK